MRLRYITALVLAALFLLSTPARTTAQTCENRLDGACSIAPDTAYTFGQAKAHAHDAPTSVTGFYCGRGLINDPSNTVGNIFLGNTVCLVDMYGEHWYYYDWGADADATVKLAVWTNNYPWQWVTVNYDITCKRASQVYNPWTGGV